MSVLTQLTLLADYNKLMNQRLFAAAENLSKDDLYRDCGAFFKSVIGTLNHILVGDILWLQRFANHPSSSNALSYLIGLERPERLDAMLYDDLSGLKTQREIIDDSIIAWIAGLCESDVSECLAYTNMKGASFTKRFDSLINHLFLHQIHHRGQVTTLLSQFGVDFGETDIVEIIGECGV